MIRTAPSPRSLCWIMLLATFSMGISCDPYHKEKCEWYLEPEPEHIDLVEPGWVSLCARNFERNKQRCYLKATIEYAKAVQGKPFRYSTMKVKNEGPYPREVESIKTCKPGSDEPTDK